MALRSERRSFKPTVDCLESRLALSGVYTVTNLNSGYGQGSLGWAIQASNETQSFPWDPNTINFNSTFVRGTISESSRLTVTGNVNIMGPADHSVTVSGGGITQIMAIVGGGHVNINNMVFSGGVANGRNGNDVNGGAIVDYNSVLGLNSDTFIQNVAYQGGGAVAFSNYCSGSQISDSTFYWNTAWTIGGAVASWCPLYLSGDSIYGNYAQYTGGGLYAVPGTYFAHPSWITNNRPNDIAIY